MSRHASLGAGVMGLEPITGPVGAVIGAIARAVVGGNVAKTIYDNGFEGNINYIMQPVNDVKAVGNTIQNMLLNAQAGGHAW